MTYDVVAKGLWTTNTYAWKLMVFGSAVLDSIASLFNDCCGADSSHLVVIWKRRVGCVPFCEVEKEARDSLDLYSSVNSPKTDTEAQRFS